MEHRTYLWLHLTFDIIKQSPSEYGRRCDVETLLSDLPSEVSQTYEKILGRSKNEIYTETLLQIVLAAARPLTLDEANTALTLALLKQRFLSYTDLESKLWSPKVFQSIVKNLCGLFVSVYDSKLSFIHQTAREFLIHPERKGKWQGRLNMSESHGKMSLVCLAYLSYLGGQSPVTEIKKQFPLAQYSARYWMDHARHAETQKDVQESILNFFQQREAYAVWGSLFDPDRPWDQEPWGYENMATPLYYASLAGLQYTVELLTEKGADVNVQGGDDGNALQAASSHGHKEVVLLLLEKGADVNAQGGDYGNALQAASWGGHKEVVLLLLEKGADVNAQGGFYGNALQAASQEGYNEVVLLLLEKGADVNAAGRFHGNALQAASTYGHKEVVQLLLEKGADVNLQGDFGNALQAASQGGHKEVVQLLLEKGADVNMQGVNYGSALQAAYTYGHMEVVLLLLEKGAEM
jgi:ankyrin repeat protein